MQKEDLVKHQGIISEITNDNIRVSIMAQSACASCHAKGFCGAADMQEKFIDVKNYGGINQKVGDFVTVTMRRRLGTKAVLYGYFLPFVLLLATLIVMLSILDNEGLAGLISLGVLVPYYFGLYMLKDRLKQGFEFHIEQKNPSTNFNFNLAE